MAGGEVGQSSLGPGHVIGASASDKVICIIEP
jgi:hypothetical protein